MAEGEKLEKSRTDMYRTEDWRTSYFSLSSRATNGWVLGVKVGSECLGVSSGMKYRTTGRKKSPCSRPKLVTRVTVFANDLIMYTGTTNSGAMHSRVVREACKVWNVSDDFRKSHLDNGPSDCLQYSGYHLLLRVQLFFSRAVVVIADVSAVVDGESDSHDDIDHRNRV